MRNSKYFPIKFEITGNYTSKLGCTELCNQKFYFSSFPSVEDMFLLRERKIDPGKKLVSLLAKFTLTQNQPKASNIPPMHSMKTLFCKEIFKRKVQRAHSKGKIATKKVKLKYIDRNIFFLTNGYFDFNDRLWKSGKHIIRRVLIDTIE